MWDDVEEETPAPAAPAEEPAAPAPGAEATAADSSKAEAETPAPENPTESPEARRLVFKHWTRPRFLQYGYLYDYQHSYYDDLINYLDRRNQGLPTERPRAQTWGERALRTYLSKSTSSYSSTKKQDALLLHHISIGAKFQRYHSKSLISRKYSRLGFNTISI